MSQTKTEDDFQFLAMANNLALRSIDAGGGPFGALIVKEGSIIAQASNSVVKICDPTAHAEILAIREAARLLGSHNLEGSTLYSSCEPCPMCLGAIYWAHISRVVFSSSRFDAAKSGFDDDFIYNEIALDKVKRQIPFIHSPESDKGLVFKHWDETENKTAY